MRKRTSKSLVAQSEHWDGALTSEQEWIEISDAEPIFIPRSLGRKLNRASKREGMPTDDLATILLEKAMEA